MNNLSSRDLDSMLRKRFNKSGPGGSPRYLLGAEVRLDAFGSRSADMIVQDTWSGGGNDPLTQYPRHGFEIKVSRSDWLAELRDPFKAAAFRPYCHFWNLVIADKNMVKEDELPDGWGMLVPLGDNGSLLQVIRPKRNYEVKQMPVGMMASFLRRVTDYAQRQVPIEVSA